MKKLFSVIFACTIFFGSIGTAWAEESSPFVSTDVMIYDIFSAGGYQSLNNDGTPKNTALYNCCYVILYNNTANNISLENYTLEYALGNSDTFDPSYRTPLNGKTINAHSYLVIQGGLCTDGNIENGGALPVTADAVNPNYIMVRKSGKVALCDGTVDPSTLSRPIAGLMGVVDFVGYGSANDFEGTVAEEPSVTKSLKRVAKSDTNNNRADFAAVAVNLNYLTEPPYKTDYNLTFSNDAGFYTQEFDLTISTDLPNGKIYYTIDGSDPTVENGIEYTTPVHIVDRTSEPNKYSQTFGNATGNVMKGTSIKAKAFDTEGNTSKLHTNTYFVNSNPEFFKIPVVSLTVNPDDYFGENGMYVKYQKEYDIRAMVNCELFEADGTRGFTQSAESKISGSSTRGYAQKSLNIKFKENGANTTLDYPIFPGNTKENDGTTPLNAYSEFRLHIGGNDVMYSQFRDAYAQAIATDYLNVNTTAYRPCLMFINGEFWGTYGMRERLTDGFFKINYYMDSDDVLIIQISTGNNIEVDEGKEEWASAYTDFYNYINSTDFSVDSNYQVLDTEWVNLDSYLDYIILNTFVGNKDWPGNNTVIFKNMNANAADKRWKYIPYDLDYSYGLNNGILSVSANEDSFGYLMRNIPLVNWTLNDEPSTLLFRKLIQNSQFKEELIDRYVYHLNTTFNKQRLNTVLDKFYNEVNEYKNMQFNRWSLPLTWGGTISDMRRFINNREAGIISSISRNLGTDGETKGSFANTAQGKLQIQIGDKSINIDKSLSGSFIKNRPIKLAAPQGDTFRGFQIVDGANSYIVNESNYEFVPTADNFSVEVLTDGGEIENYNALAAGDGHIVKIVNGAVKTWGKNAKGQIAQWNTNNMSTEVELKYQNTIGHQQTRFSFTNAKSVFAANEQSFVLTEDGKLYSSGDDSYYQINNGGSTPGARDYMAQIYRQSNRTVNNEIGNIKEVAAGQKHTLFIDENNMLYSCGSNDYDQLGNGSMASSGTHLIKVSETLLFKSVAAGEKHSLAVTTDGNLYAFGDNSLGQFGDGTVISSNVPKFIMNNVDKVFTKYNSTFILKADGTVYACGDNTFGQLGTGNTDNALTPVHVMDNCAYISTSKTNTVFITSDNYLWTVGSNAYGQLLSGTSLMNTTPAKVRGNCASAVAGNGFVAYENSAGQLFIKGNNAYGQLCSGSISENDTDAFILNSIGVSCNANIENEIIPKDIEISGYAVNGSVTSGAKDITVYFAVYSKSGKLVDLISDKVTVNALLKSEFSLKKILNNSYSTDNYFCRLMCWDSSAMIPVNKVSVEKNP